MKRLTITTLIVAAALSLAATEAGADVKLEVGLQVTPTELQDVGYEAVSSDDLSLTRAGGDLRLDLGSVSGVHFVPLIGYRVGVDEGNPYYMLDTRLVTNDFVAGLRVRGWLLSWLGVFVEAHGGLFWARLGAEVDDDYSYYQAAGVRERYEDDEFTWTAGGLGGVEVRISPRWLEKRGVTWFDFGAELGAGYIRRGAVAFRPELVGGDEHSLPVGQTADWGDLDMSGWFVQLGLTFTFL
jgi:hypothetical protein